MMMKKKKKKRWVRKRKEVHRDRDEASYVRLYLRFVDMLS